jgi:sterol desaturase/sphingolipid hydroxylase (fatty acid hydroxylase superfamily)
LTNFFEERLFSVTEVFLSPLERAYVPYLASSLFLALVVFMRHITLSKYINFLSFRRFVLPKTIYAHRSALVDYAFFVVNRLTFIPILAPLLISTTIVSHGSYNFYKSIWGPPTTLLPEGFLLEILIALSIALASDLGMFLAHYLQHKIRFLWEFHKVHHSAEVLTPITVYRFHPVDDILYMTFSGTMAGLAHGILTYLSPNGYVIANALGVNIVFFLFYLIGYNLRHSHIWLSYGPLLSLIFISPAQHQIHHSKDPQHTDKNLGFVFAFWDLLAGRLYVPKNREALIYGLRNDEEKNYQGLLKLYFKPFKELFKKDSSKTKYQIK